MRRRSIHVFGCHLIRRPKYNAVIEIASRISPVNPQAFPERIQRAWCFLCKHYRWRLFRHPCPYCKAGTNVSSSTSVSLGLRDHIFRACRWAASWTNKLSCCAHCFCSDGLYRHSVKILCCRLQCWAFQRKSSKCLSAAS